MDDDRALPAAQRLLAERRLLAALRRLHQRAPLRDSLRVDALIAVLRGAADRRPATHRGTTPLTLDDRELRSLVAEMLADGRLAGSGRMVRLPSHRPALEPGMAARVEALLATLDRAGAAPPPAEAHAKRLGIPAAMVDQLRDAGELVHLAPGIDYPRASWEHLAAELERLAASGPLSVARVRDELQATRRHAEALLRRRRAASGRPA